MSGRVRRLVVDTAALALHLACTPAYVRLLVSAGIIAPVERRRLRATGRPTMWFDVTAVDEHLEQARHAGRMELDRDRWRLRNST